MKKSILSILCLVAVLSLSLVSCGKDKKAKTETAVAEANTASKSKGKIVASEEAKALFTQLKNFDTTEFVEADVEDGDYFPNGGDKKIVVDMDNCTVTYEGKTYYAKEVLDKEHIALYKANGSKYGKLLIRMSGSNYLKGIVLVVGDEYLYFAQPEEW